MSGSDFFHFALSNGNFQPKIYVTFGATRPPHSYRPNLRPFGNQRSLTLMGVIGSNMGGCFTPEVWALGARRIVAGLLASCMDYLQLVIPKEGGRPSQVEETA